MRALPLILILAACPAPACGPWFEEAPPTLLALNDRLPAKSMGEIFLETAPPAKSEELDHRAELKKLAARLGAEPGAALVPAVDALLENAREHYSDGAMCNLLHDARDALAGPATAEEQREYLLWRAIPGAGAMETIDAKIASASEAMRPHWVYLRGAIAWSEDPRKAQRWFDWVAAEWPRHSRAEFALFMSARCRLSRTLMHTWEEKVTAEQLAAERADARVRFEEYLKDYPKGRLVADTEGWLGGLAYRAGDHMEALRCYLRQAEAPGHPELLKSCAFMCEKTLDAIVSGEAPDEEAFALVARHPRVAMGLMYLVLNSPTADNFNGEPDDSARVRRWRREVLPRIATAVAAEGRLYEKDAWQPRYLALLAQSASAAGDQATALQLTEGGAESDDLLLARGVAMQRAGRPGDAAATLGRLAEKFPQSPLAKGARLRRALALADDHRAGEAVVALRALLPPPDDRKRGYDTDSVYPPPDDELTLRDSAVIRDLSGAEETQIEQNIDALLNFAPVGELAAMLDMPELDEAAKSELRAVLAQRCLVAEDFDGARKWMTPAQFELTAGKLARLTERVGAARGAEAKARAQMALGDAWAAARGQALVAPLDTVSARRLICFDDHERALSQRQANGRALGLPGVDEELENRDALRHASRWWMRAAHSAPRTLGAKARLRALEAMPRIARVSDFAYQRAVETGAGAASREIYDRLRAEAPDSEEARKAAWWSFPPLPLDWAGRARLRAGAEAPEKFAGYFFDTFGAFADRQERRARRKADKLDWKMIEAGALALRDAAARLESAELAEQAARLAEAARASHVSESSAAIVNCLDDLALFFQEPDLTPEMRRRYVDLRMNVFARSSWPFAPFAPPAEIAFTDEATRAAIQKTLADPAMKPAADYLEFLDMAMVANHATRVPLPELDKDGEPLTYASRDYAAVERMARAFLKKHPKSRKREATAMVLSRAVHRQSWPHVKGYEVAHDGTLLSISSYGDNNAEVVAQLEPFDAKRVLAPLDAYDREFPSGRYAATIRDYRATVLWRTRRWGEALDLTLAQLAMEEHGELLDDAAQRMANIFADLARPEARPELLAAIGERPAALERLREYLEAGTGPAHPLWFLREYLCEQLHFTLPPVNAPASSA